MCSLTVYICAVSADWREWGSYCIVASGRHMKKAYDLCTWEAHENGIRRVHFAKRYAHLTQMSCRLDFSVLGVGTVDNRNPAAGAFACWVALHQCSAQ